MNQRMDSRNMEVMLEYLVTEFSPVGRFITPTRSGITMARGFG
jgi:hypothetical protein